jgi:transcriptional regulator GlxA family with amidase domain
VRFDILVFDGFDELDAIGPFEVLSSVRSMGADIAVRLVTLAPQEMVQGLNGARVATDGVLVGAGADRPDVLIVSGGGWASRAARGVFAEVQRGEIQRAVAAAHAAGSTVAGVCSGGMVLAHAGLTAGRPAITHHTAIEELRQSGAVVTDARVVDDVDVLTSGGVTSGIDLALHLVHRFFGAHLAASAARRMEYTPQGPVFTRGGTLRQPSPPREDQAPRR